MHGNFLYIIVFFSVRRPSPEPGKLWRVCEIVIHSWNRRPVVDCPIWLLCAFRRGLTLNLITCVFECVAWAETLETCRTFVGLGWCVVFNRFLFSEPVLPFGRSLVIAMFWLVNKVCSAHLPPVIKIISSVTLSKLSITASPLLSERAVPVPWIINKVNII